jgi:hypothetical protein
MTTKLVPAVLCLASAWPAFADPPAASAPADLCSVPDNAILRPNTEGRPFPVLKGDPAHPKVACLVKWQTLSPDNHALAVRGCFDGKLLELPNDSACGRGTGPLWVERRWVVTRADKPPPANALASCQSIDTSTNAATRDFHPECQAPKADTPAGSPAKRTPRALPETAEPAAPAAPK